MEKFMFYIGLFYFRRKVLIEIRKTF